MSIRVIQTYLVNLKIDFFRDLRADSESFAKCRPIVPISRILIGLLKSMGSNLKSVSKSLGAIALTERCPWSVKIFIIRVIFHFRIQDMGKLRKAQSKINELEKFLKEEMDEKEDIPGERYHFISQLGSKSPGIRELFMFPKTYF